MKLLGVSQGMLCVAYLMSVGQTKMESLDEFGPNLKPLVENAKTIKRITKEPKVGYKYQSMSFSRGGTSVPFDFKMGTNVYG